MSLEREKSFAKENGFYRLGASEVEVEIPLTSTEKIELGKAQSESLCEIGRLETELADIKGQYKNKIESHQIIVDSTAQIIRRGAKMVKKKLPSFIDTKEGKKHWVDLDTGEIVLTRDALPEDRQADLLNE